MFTTLSDVRLALRLLRRQPAFALFAILTLAIGIGAATAVFTLVNSTLLRQMPFADPNRLVWMYNARTERDRAPFSIADLNDYARENTTLSGLATFINWPANLSGAGDPERLEGTRVSGNFFLVLGSQARLGRVLTPDDEATNAKVAMLTDGVWKRRFGSDPNIVGNRIILNDTAYIIVGVLPSGFVFPFRDAEVAVPLALRDDPRRSDRGANFLRVVARLKLGASIPQAKADLDAIARRLQRQFPNEDARKTGVNLYPLQSEIVSDYRQILWTLFGAVGALLAIGCGNLANLVLVRATMRSPELALRVSLGATRGRIIRQLVTESAVLAIFGGLVGCLVAVWAVAAWRAFGPANFPGRDHLAVDVRVLLFAAGAALTTALVAGLLPALSVSAGLRQTLGGQTRSVTGTRRQGLVRRAFVMLQVACCAVLLVCMALVVQAFGRLEQVDPGFARDHALTVQLSLPPTRYATRESLARFYEALQLRLASLQGVDSVGAVSLLPLSGLLAASDLVLPDRPAPPPNEVPQAQFRVASPHYFAAAGIRVMAGREFSADDTAAGRPVVVVSRTLAARHWPGQDPIGKPLQIEGWPPVMQVVGVVSDVKQFGLDGAGTADLYLPLHQMPPSQTSPLAARLYWVIRSRSEPRALEAAVKNAVHAVDPDVAASSTRTLDDVLSTSLAARRLNVRLLELFGEVAVLLAAVGVYAIAAFSANSRKRELAIRSAFGATSVDLSGLVLLGELRPTLLGLILGLACALGVSRLLGDALFAITASDPLTYGAVAVGLLAVVVAASSLPAVRAGRANPAELMRA